MQRVELMTGKGGLMFWKFLFKKWINYGSIESLWMSWWQRVLPLRWRRSLRDLRGAEPASPRGDGQSEVWGGHLLPGGSSRSRCWDFSGLTARKGFPASLKLATLPTSPSRWLPTGAVRVEVELCVVMEKVASVRQIFFLEWVLEEVKFINR